MKTLCILSLLFIIMLTFHVCIIYGADWQYYAQDSEGNLLYVDKASITELNGIVYVWQEKVYANENLFRIRQILGEKYYKLIEKITLYEIYCPTKTSQVRASAYYDNNDKVIDSRYEEFKRDWKKIMPYTDMALLYRICCVKEEKK